jgi:hypothetical protein
MWGIEWRGANALRAYVLAAQGGQVNLAEVSGVFYHLGKLRQAGDPRAAPRRIVRAAA